MRDVLELAARRTARQRPGAPDDRFVVVVDWRRAECGPAPLSRRPVASSTENWSLPNGRDSKPTMKRVFAVAAGPGWPRGCRQWCASGNVSGLLGEICSGRIAGPVGHRKRNSVEGHVVGRRSRRSSARSSSASLRRFLIEKATPSLVFFRLPSVYSFFSSRLGISIVYAPSILAGTGPVASWVEPRRMLIGHQRLCNYSYTRLWGQAFFEATSGCNTWPSVLRP